MLDPATLKEPARCLQGNLPCKKTHPPRTLPESCAWGPRAVLGGWALSYERGTPVGVMSFLRTAVLTGVRWAHLALTFYRLLACARFLSRSLSFSLSRSLSLSLSLVLCFSLARARSRLYWGAFRHEERENLYGTNDLEPYT